jgi:hypothetical protein
MKVLMFGLLASFALTTVVSAAAATIHVPDDQPTIQAGIDAACAGDTVLVACGTYYEHDIQMKPGVCLRSVTGYPDCVVVNAQQIGRVMSCPYAGSDTRIEGISITNGHVSTSGGSGAGMICSGSPTFSHVVFSGNSASHIEGTGAGGLSCESPTLTYVTFVGNSANGDGGAMGCQSATLTHVVFSGNSAWWGSGGGLNCSGSPVLTDVVFSGNDANGSGGGMRSSGSPVLTDVVFDGNWSGGMSCSGGAPMITRATFVNNTMGAALECVHGASPTIDHAVFWGNDSGQGAGLFCEQGSVATVTHSTFYQNDAYFHGGGVWCAGESSVRLENSIIVFSTRGEAVYCDNTSDATLWCCDVYGNSGGDWIGCIAGQEHVSYNICANPLFCLWENPSEPLSLCADSPCIRPVCGGYIGAHDTGCGSAVPVENASWGTIKAMFR